MRSRTFFLFVALSFALLWLGLARACPAAAEDLKLDKDTALPIAGKGTKLMFAGGTKVKLNGERQVEQGVIAQDTALGVPGIAPGPTFKKGTKVTFAWQGIVKEGTLADDAVLKVEGTGQSIRFKGGCKVIFGDSGLLCGTLAESLSLPNPARRWVPETFPAGTYVMFTAITGHVYLVVPPK
ncbi:MAG: hypothetical protein RDV48_23660 [Candidatus Eremiobacteraeota bacterium]|nr:hypothetical protein [Candidatus Eremiobacteraeota bacterium]